MKRKDTILSIEAIISTLAFNKDTFKEDMEKLAFEIRKFGTGTYDFWQVEPVNTVIRTTAIETSKLVKFVFKLNFSNSNYENWILTGLCLNLQKVFNSRNLICNEPNQCYILSTRNSRLDK